MRPPAPRQVVLARDKFRAECALSAVPVPGIEMSMQPTKLAGRVGRSEFFCAHFPVLAGKLGLDEVADDCVHSPSDSHQMLEPIFVPNKDSSHWLAILVQYSLRLPPIFQCKYGVV